MDYNKLIEEKTKLDICDRPNLKEKCPYYPCHDISNIDFDCRTCYCPFYEMCSKDNNKFTGGYLLNEQIWACENCNFIHKKEIVEKIIELRSKNIEYKDIYKMLMK